MVLHKTEKARAALQRRSDALSVLDRRVLILSDGRRELKEIAGLLGGDSRRAALRLVEERYLSATAVPDGDASRRTAQLGVGTSATAAPIPAGMVASMPAPGPPEPPARAPVAGTATRRSLVAAKMYMLDMLQLQRGPESATIRSTLQSSVGRDALLAAVLEGVRHIQRVAPASYGLRVYQRVEEVLPEDALPALQTACGRPLAAAG